MEKSNTVSLYFIEYAKRNEKIIVSLTSFPGRIHLVHKTIQTILLQSVKPDLIELWLAKEQFPNLEKIYQVS